MAVFDSIGDTAEERRSQTERIIAEELARAGWQKADLQTCLKSDPVKLRMSARVRSETTLSIKQIAQRLHLGTWKSPRALLSKMGREKDRENEWKENTLV